VVLTSSCRVASCCIECSGIFSTLPGSIRNEITGSFSENLRNMKDSDILPVIIMMSPRHPVSKWL
jgi:hypothetical protein